VKIACCDYRTFDIAPDCQVKVLPHGRWYRVTSVVGNIITGERWLENKYDWDRDHAIVIPREKIFYVIQPSYWEVKL